MFADVRRIQNSIQVTTAAAMTIAKPSKICSAGSSRPPIVVNSTRPITDAERDRGPRAEPDLAEVPLVSGPGEIGEDDADDERRLDAFTQPGQKPGRQESEVQLALQMLEALT